MSGVNKAIIVGRLGNNPELRFTSNGTPVASLSIATSETWTNKDGKKEEKTEWHRIIVWGKLGENCNNYLSKGREVYVEGKIKTRKWQDKQGVDRYTTEIIASQVVFLGNGQSSNGNNHGPNENLNQGNEQQNSDDIPF